MIAALLFGGNVIGGGSDSGFSPGGFDPAPAAGSNAQPGDPEDTVFEFTKFVAKDTQDTWEKLFAQSDKQYPRAPVVIFSTATQSGCGTASSQTGPFYCPADNKVYLDLSFFNELSRRFGAPGDFAAAYVIAHEVGHHVQSVLGIEAEVRRKQQDDPDNANLYLVRLELQADCFAGVWARSTYDRGLLESGDLEEGLGAAAAVGDDRLGARSPRAVDARLVRAPRAVVQDRASTRATRATATPATSGSSRRPPLTVAARGARARYPHGTTLEED